VAVCKKQQQQNNVGWGWNDRCRMGRGGRGFIVDGDARGAPDPMWPLVSYFWPVSAG